MEINRKYLNNLRSENRQPGYRLLKRSDCDSSIRERVPTTDQYDELYVTKFLMTLAIKVNEFSSVFFSQMAI